MAIVYQKDKHSGITYAYDSKSHWDEEKKQSRSTRHLIGRVDPATGAIVPTDGRNRIPKQSLLKSIRASHTSITAPLICSLNLP